eukprot:CAMPEP_0201487150 /NCGR_PEP_ID=MMETSP0151_2-20130828/11144_1 /ASSEMBLY_ACC=CAM_ASM_000257 /TAXON_ID=200890 /ORGANISM="Paramoeba atlantica, Strain 621/1 / CCAP 1560/9" /LENGTH=255 /DNA_ID=CAMNT_0047872129 /DNA_START=241 /DNA_END=1008 /DNA_ORIENTATION=+
MAESNGKISGFLQKRGEKGLVKNFKKRWFVFDGNDPQKRVFYYPSPDDMKELGYIQMDQVTEIRKTSNIDFEVITPNRTYFLQSPAEKETEQWIASLRSHIKGAGGSSASSAVDPNLLKEKDDQIAKLEEKMRLLQADEGGDEGKLRKELMATREELETLKKNSGAQGDLSADLQKKDEEIQSVQSKMKGMEESYSEELVELKKEYFRACAIGIVQQRKITKDLPPVAELYKRCLDDGTEWKDYVPWIKTTLPKK